MDRKKDLLFIVIVLLVSISGIFYKAVDVLNKNTFPEKAAHAQFLATSTHADSPSSATGHCLHSNEEWHGPTIDGCFIGHEHGDSPPVWVINSKWKPTFNHPANTPDENVHKHSSFKAFNFFNRHAGQEVYVIAHLDTNPLGHTSRFHSYKVWMKDTVGNISHWQGWMDFGGDDAVDRPNVRVCSGADSFVPIMAVNKVGCPIRLESWYSRPGGSGGWSWDFSFDLKANYYTDGNPAEPSTWKPTGDLNDLRHLKLNWYDFRSSYKGVFWTNQWGDLVTGPSDPICGTTKKFGSKEFKILCLEQYIAKTAKSFDFYDNTMEKIYPMEGVGLPN